MAAAARRRRQEIKALIDNSVAAVASGSAHVGEAGQSITHIVAQVRHVSQLIARISAASSAQSAGMAGLGSAITELDASTQQNAALVEPSAAAADSLSRQAEQLESLVGVFKLNAPA